MALGGRVAVQCLCQNGWDFLAIQRITVDWIGKALWICKVALLYKSLRQYNSLWLQDLVGFTQTLVP
jgi:hypothetical protein